MQDVMNNFLMQVLADVIGGGIALAVLLGIVKWMDRRDERRRMEGR